MRGLALAMVLVGVGGASARAEKSDDALKLLDQGMALFQSGDYTGAREAFARARDLVPEKANPYRWLGLTDSRLGRCKEAVAELDTFLSRVQPSDPRAVEAATLRDRCKDELAPKLGTLVVESSPPGAEVRLDDENAAVAGQTPWRSETVPAGSHVVFLKKAGFLPLSKGFAVGQRATITLELSLQPIPLPPPVVAPAPVNAPVLIAKPLPPPKPKKKLSKGALAAAITVPIGALALSIGITGLIFLLDRTPATALPPVGQ